MKKFGFYCKKCEKEDRDAKIGFNLFLHQEVRKIYIHFRCYSCGEEEDFYFTTVKDFEEAKKIQKIMLKVKVD